MKRIHSALTSRNGPKSSGCYLMRRMDPVPEIRFDNQMNMRAIFVATIALSLISDCAFGQTTRTNPAGSSTSKTIPSSSSTSPNSPCNPTNPTSPCYSANAPRNPCYSATAPNQPCSTTTTPNSRTSPAPSPALAATPQAAVRAFTQDQAKSQIEAKGYSSVSELRKDAKGIWRGKAEKDGLPVNVTLDVNGDVTAN
jgi:cell wall-associated NlpC family hydrolase